VVLSAVEGSVVVLSTMEGSVVVLSAVEGSVVVLSVVEGWVRNSRDQTWKSRAKVVRPAGWIFHERTNERTNERTDTGTHCVANPTSPLRTLEGPAERDAMAEGGVKNEKKKQ